MRKTRRKFTGSFKAKVVLEALKEKDTLATLAAKYEVAGTVISKWKQEFISASAGVFDGKHDAEDSASDDKLQAFMLKKANWRLKMTF